MNDVLAFLQNNIVMLDGGMGTLLQAKGLAAGESPERWNLTHPTEIVAIHKAYFEAGSNIVCANTFGANTLSFDAAELEGIIKAAISNAKAARDTASGTQKKFIALDIGPTGKLLAPLGTFPFEEAVAVFAQTIKLGVKYGADLIFIETMNDCYETKAAVLAAKENADLPIFVSNAYGENGRLMTGATPTAMVAMLEGLGVQAIGANCSLGPQALTDVVRELLAVASVPVLFKPNAGLPKTENGKTVFDVTPDAFATTIATLVDEGVRVVGGCCGTTPSYISVLRDVVSAMKPLPLSEKARTVVSSFSEVAVFGARPLLVGERINPTGKKKFKEALLASDIAYILREGVAQQDAGAHVLDVNVGMPGISEPDLLPQVVRELQGVVSLPIQIDTSDVLAMERALRAYNGKALINSVNGKAESMQAVFPLVQKYGGVVVALTLDEDGIPADVEGRVKIAKKILKTAKSYGIAKKDIVFDTLTMAISADASAAQTTIRAQEVIRQELGCHTILGVSNVSFGLPAREILNAAFFGAALERGLSAAIMNPHSAEMQKTYLTYNALHGVDTNFAAYISSADVFLTGNSGAVGVKNANSASATSLADAILRGLKEDAACEAAALLTAREPLDIVTAEIIPALDVVGQKFEKKTLYLPQLLMSAEAAKSAFAVLKDAMQTKQNAPSRGPIVLATVHGDIHDIGKNIVKLLLENYGFAVCDLGKDVPPETIVAAVLTNHAPVCGLSALMTTTVPAMEETIARLAKEAPWCRVMVGGAVLTAEYAAKIGAHAYAKDAMASVRCAEAWMK